MSGIPFEAVLTYVDTPSSKSPGGARGHRVILREEALRSLLPEFVGLPVNCSPSLSRHEMDDIGAVIGIVISAKIVDKAVVIDGYLFPALPNTRFVLEASKPLGMSYELRNASVVDVRSRIWEIKRCELIGASIILNKLVAYDNTWVKLGEQS